MNDDTRAAGGLNHLIEQLRLSDSARAQSHGDHGAPMQANGLPNPNMQHPQAQYSRYEQGTRANQWPSTPPAQRQHSRRDQEQQYRQNFHGQGYNSQPRHSNQGTQRGISLMDYVKSPGFQNVSINSPEASRPQRSLQQPSTPQAPHYRQYNRNSPNVRQNINTAVQAEYLEQLARDEIPRVAIDQAEFNAKQEFRSRLESICQSVLSRTYPTVNARLSFIPYGSMLSGFAVTGSDMDIICSIEPPMSNLEPDVIPRMFEGELLNARIGARALTRTRVPILKICEMPSESLRQALLIEHQNWMTGKDRPNDVAEEGQDLASATTDGQRTKSTKDGLVDVEVKQSAKRSKSKERVVDTQPETPAEKDNSAPKPRQWRREKVLGPLDFPKTGVGFQCDVSFRGLLGVHNTQLLRCYSACDPRVRDMVLFVKSWAKRRQINNSYSGTLCSYGWVLMVLHFLINIVRPPVLPNLQHEFGAANKSHIVDGYNVAFADDEMQLHQMAMQRRLTQNQESLGSLLRNFFHYYAHQGPRVIGGGFRWKDDVISIRSQSGIISKASKGWTGASNTMVNNVEVRQRYLLAVECPFEIDHNVARTVHHYGVVAIRDELRRAWDILEAVRNNRPLPGGLFDRIEDPVDEQEMEAKQVELETIVG